MRLTKSQWQQNDDVHHRERLAQWQPLARRSAHIDRNPLIRGITHEWLGVSTPFCFLKAKRVPM